MNMWPCFRVTYVSGHDEAYFLRHLLAPAGRALCPGLYTVLWGPLLTNLKQTHNHKGRHNARAKDLVTPTTHNSRI